MKSFNPNRQFNDNILREFNASRKFVIRRSFWLTILCSVAISSSLLPWPKIEMLAIESDWNDFLIYRILLFVLGVAFLTVSWQLPYEPLNVSATITIHPDSEDSKLKLLIDGHGNDKKIEVKEFAILDNSLSQFYFVGRLIFLDCDLEKLKFNAIFTKHYFENNSKNKNGICTICFEISDPETKPSELVLFLNETTDFIEK